MDFNVFQMKLAELLPDLQVLASEPMSKHTSFRIGGPAKLMAFPKNTDELSKILKLSNDLDIPFAILGAGTNVLAPDDGLQKLVICLKNSLDGMKQLDDTHIWAAAGVTMTRAAVYAAGLGLSGLEFAHGIPGTVGGGVYMNAGAYDGEISRVCTRTDAMDQQGNTFCLTADEMQFSYRHSILQDRQAIAVGAVFELQPALREQIQEKMRELLDRRRASQPLELPSAGSAFKRPAGGYAAALIQEAGLKNFTVGGASVSGKHSGFVVNNGDATAQDVKTLLQQVSDCVFEKSGIRLYPEIRIW